MPRKFLDLLMMRPPRDISVPYCIIAPESSSETRPRAGSS